MGLMALTFQPILVFSIIIIYVYIFFYMIPVGNVISSAKVNNTLKVIEQM